MIAVENVLGDAENRRGTTVEEVLETSKELSEVGVENVLGNPEGRCKVLESEVEFSQGPTLLDTPVAAGGLFESILGLDEGSVVSAAMVDWAGADRTELLVSVGRGPTPPGTLDAGVVLATPPGALDGVKSPGPLPLSWKTLRLLIAQYASLNA